MRAVSLGPVQTARCGGVAGWSARQVSSEFALIQSRAQIHAPDVAVKALKGEEAQFRHLDGRHEGLVTNGLEVSRQRLYANGPLVTIMLAMDDLEPSFRALGHEACSDCAIIDDDFCMLIVGVTNGELDLAEGFQIKLMLAAHI